MWVDGEARAVRRPTPTTGRAGTSTSTRSLWRSAPRAAVAATVRTARRRRPWDAAMFAAAPMLALTATINWDLLRRRVARPRHVGVGARDARGGRRPDRARRGREVLSAVRPRAAAGAVPAGRPDAGVLRRCSAAAVVAWLVVERAGHGGRLRRLVEVLRAQPGPRRRVQLDLVRAEPAGPRRARAPAQHGRRRARSCWRARRSRCWRCARRDGRGWRSWCSSSWPRSC